MSTVERTEIFEAERPRLLRVAARVLGDRAEAADVVQQAWLRLHRTGADIESLPAWLTTVTTRLCCFTAASPLLHRGESVTGH